MLLEDMAVIQEFPDVFNEIVRLPPSRVVESIIDVIPSMTPNSKATYCMVPKVLDEMKKLLSKLCEKGQDVLYIMFFLSFLWCHWNIAKPSGVYVHKFIWPNTSPYGTLAIFVSKKYIN